MQGWSLSLMSVLVKPLKQNWIYEVQLDQFFIHQKIPTYLLYYRYRRGVRWKLYPSIHLMMMMKNVPDARTKLRGSSFSVAVRVCRRGLCNVCPLIGIRYINKILTHLKRSVTVTTAVNMYYLVSTEEGCRVIIMAYTF